MGNSFSRHHAAPVINERLRATPISLPTQKRYIDSVYDNPSKSSPDPVRKKRLKSTSEYIYDALFVNGENSDITIRSLGKEWKLHKVYLRQAKYFKSLYDSKWKESTMETIDLQIPDANIDVKALDITFGTLYSEIVLIPPSKVISILAAASLIQLDGLMQQCAEVMKETICMENVFGYLKAASMYGLEDVCRQSISWFETNLMLRQSRELLSEMHPELLADVVRSPNLVVIQIEMDIYTMLKKWLYLRLHPSYSGDFKSILPTADTYFHQEAESTNTFFLESENGQVYSNVFKALRLQHIIRDFVSCRELERDRIIPWSWMSQQYRQQWLTMLRVEQSIDSGPTEFDNETFESNSLRCGRMLLRDADHCWRWNGYSFGLDLLISYSSHAPRTITFRRNVRSQRCSSSVSLSASRSIVYRVTVASVNDKGQTVLRKSTENTPLNLQKEQEQIVLTLGGESAPDQSGTLRPWKSYFPLIVTATFQLVNDLESPELIYSGNSIKPFPGFDEETRTLGGAGVALEESSADE